MKGLEKKALYAAGVVYLFCLVSVSLYSLWWLPTHYTDFYQYPSQSQSHE